MGWGGVWVGGRQDDCWVRLVWAAPAWSTTTPRLTWRGTETGGCESGCGSGAGRVGVIVGCGCCQGQEEVTIFYGHEGRRLVDGNAALTDGFAPGNLAVAPAGLPGGSQARPPPNARTRASPPPLTPATPRGKCLLPRLCGCGVRSLTEELVVRGSVCSLWACAHAWHTSSPQSAGRHRHNRGHGHHHHVGESRSLHRCRDTCSRQQTSARLTPAARKAWPRHHPSQHHQLARLASTSHV